MGLQSWEPESDVGAAREPEDIAHEEHEEPVHLYTDVRINMASRSDNGDFRPVSTRVIPEDVPTTDLLKVKESVEEDNSRIKTGYERIKQKVKDMRQDHSKAVTEGRRSGRGKLVCDNWDILKNLGHL